MDSKIIMLSVLTALLQRDCLCAAQCADIEEELAVLERGSVQCQKCGNSLRAPRLGDLLPFDRKNDLQVVAVEQNGEKEATEKTGRTGGMPFIGKGVYRTSFEVPDTAGKTVTLVFDGVMSNARVKLNGKDVASW